MLQSFGLPSIVSHRVVAILEILCGYRREGKASQLSELTANSKVFGKERHEWGWVVRTVSFDSCRTTVPHLSLAIECIACASDWNGNCRSITLDTHLQRAFVWAHANKR